MIPKVSIILPTYNGEKYITQAIESVFLQNFSNFELIIINDVSLDNTEKVVLESIKEDQRIKYFKNETKIGFPQSLNQGLSVSKGEYITRIDDDDVWCDKNKLKKQIEFLEENKNYVLVGSGAIAIDNKGEELYHFLEPEKDEEIRNYILYRNPFLHSSVIFRKDIVQKLGGYNEKVPGACDYDLWLRIGKVGKFYNFPECLIKFRVPPSYRNVAGVRREKLRRTLEKIDIIRHYRKDYPHFYQATCKDYLKLIYLSTFARFSKLDNYLYQKRQTSNWRI